MDTMVKQSFALLLALQEGTPALLCKASRKASSRHPIELKRERMAILSRPSKSSVRKTRRSSEPADHAAEVVEDRRRVPHRMAVPVLPDLTALRERIVRYLGSVSSR